MEQVAINQDFNLPRIKSDSYYDIPEELQQLKQWVVHKNKVPYQVNGDTAKSNNPNTWDLFENVVQAARSGKFHGIGFMFSKDDEYMGIDIDKCYFNGQFNETAEKLIDSLDSYTEFSVSGTGVHIIVKGSLPEHIKQTGVKNSKYGVEVYGHGRYFTMTGNRENENEIQERTDEVAETIDEFFTKEQLAQSTETTFNAEPFNFEDDSDTWLKMFNDSSTGEDIQAMYKGELIRNGDHSNTDYYLCQELAYFCDKDFVKMDRMFRNSGLMRDKWDEMRGEMTYGEITLIKAAASKKKTVSDYKKQDDFQIHVKENDSFVFPKGYLSKNGCLYKQKEDKKTGEIEEYMICRQTPIITRSFMNVEQPQLYHEITWQDEKKLYSETVLAGNLATRKKLLDLADNSLAVADWNVGELIRYFDLLNMVNGKKREHLVERLGHIKKAFIHPLTTEGVTILPPDIGERQQLEAFQASGTAEEWLVNVLEPIQKHPKALLMVLASFTSVLLPDFKLQPFIVDLSGTTSMGKTTVLRAAASVWGTEHLVNEWNITKVGAERKAAFLNSFPLILDDTRKANEKELQGFVYNFSGGRSKGRGSVNGSQREVTWSNLLLSTGEASLSAYAESAGGVAARILPITGLPFENVDYKFFNNLYESVDKYYGAIGVEFLKQWRSNQETLIPEFKIYNDAFQKKASGNEVVSRIARYYAAIVFTGNLLNKFFNTNINLKVLSKLFDELNADNKAIDKPLQLLEQILIDLDAKRESIAGKYQVMHSQKAIYKNQTLFLFPAYLKEMLKAEEKTIRSEWLRRGLTIPTVKNGKETDTRLEWHHGKNNRVVPITPEIVAKLGFDFEEQ